MTSTDNSGRISIYAQFKHLHEEELFDSSADLGDLLLTADSRPKNPLAQRELFRNARDEFRSLVLYAYALFKEHRYRQAIDVYARICSMLHHTHPPPGSAGKIGGRAVNGPKVEMPPGTTGFDRIFTEDDVKYRFAQAHLAADDPPEAMAILETIPPAARSAKVLTIMARLPPVRQTFAVEKMKHIVRQNPMALRILNTWFIYGGKLVELNANLGKNVTEEKVAFMLTKLVHCHAYMASGNYLHAYQAIVALQDESLFHQNPVLLVLQAKCQAALGNTDQAAKIFCSIDHSHPNFFHDLDGYAALLFDQADGSTLNRLADRLLKCANLSPEAWVAKGYSSLYRRDLNSAARYADHAVSLDDNHARAHILRGLICFRKDDYYGAQKSLRHVLDLCPTSIDAYKSLIEVYGKKFCDKDSLAVVSNMYKTCRKNPLAMQIYAESCIRFDHRLRDTMVHLEKHMKSYPRDSKSALLLATIYEKLKMSPQALEVLKHQLKYGNQKDIHQFLARIYHSMEDPAKEAEHLGLADAFPSSVELDPRMDSPPPGPSNGFRDSSSDSPRPASPADEDPGNESEGEDEDDEDDEGNEME